MHLIIYHIRIHMNVIACMPNALECVRICSKSTKFNHSSHRWCQWWINSETLTLFHTMILKPSRVRATSNSTFSQWFNTFPFSTATDQWLKNSHTTCSLNTSKLDQLNKSTPSIPKTTKNTKNSWTKNSTSSAKSRSRFHPWEVAVSSLEMVSSSKMTPTPNPRSTTQTR